MGVHCPGATVGVFIHGYDVTDFVTYCIQPWDLTWFPGLPRAPNAVASFTLGDTSIHVNQTIARKVFVTNHSGPVGTGAIGVRLIALVEPIQ